MKIKKDVVFVVLIGIVFFLQSCSLKPNGKLYLNLVWHQHQPSYYNPEKDELMGPWVRTHSTKDYFDMAYTLSLYPDVHATINLTSVLLQQILENYVVRLSPFVDTQENTIRARDFLAKWRGHTDPWIDLALKNTRDFNNSDLNYLYNKSGKQVWNCFSISEPIIKRFPQYRALIPKGVKIGSLVGEKDPATYTLQDLRRIKFFFYLANFDPRFLKGPIRMPLLNSHTKKMIVDLSDLVSYNDNGTPDDDSDDRFILRHNVTEKDCQRLVVEAFKVMLNIVPIHQKIMYHPDVQSGQVEIITSPFYHPILPLIYDSNLARISQPNDSLPTRFHYPEDARAQTLMAKQYYRKLFHNKLYGMWPAEGAVAQAVVPVFEDADILWIASGPHVLMKSLGKDSLKAITPKQLFRPYKLTDPKSGKHLAIFFRDWRLSDQVAFDYAHRTARTNVDAFFKVLKSYRPRRGERVLSMIMDGENAWEWFTKDNDGVRFQNLLYARISEAQKKGWLISVTPSEYILGNKHRNIPAHPIQKMTAIDTLFPGCWFSPDFKTWIGEPEENRAWDLLGTVRKDLAQSGIAAPDPAKSMPLEASGKVKAVYKAWDAMYAAEGSDWFWWYGQDQNSGADQLFDELFISHLRSVYRNLRKAGVSIKTPVLKPIIQHEEKTGKSGGAQHRVK